jgi:hypothetical protein
MEKQQQPEEREKLPQSPRDTKNYGFGMNSRFA